MRFRNSILCALLFSILLLSFFSQAQNSNKVSRVFYEVISKCVENFDSIRHLDAKYNHGTAYIVKIIEYEEDFKKLTLSITSIINGNILNDIKPFYYTYVGNEMVIISVSHIPDISLIGDEFIINDETFKEKAKYPYMVFDFSSYSLMDCPSLGIYCVELSKRRKKGRIKYFITHPIASVPLEYRPILEYNVDDKLDKYYYVDFDGEIPSREKSRFEKYQNLEDMCNKQMEIKFTKDRK